MEKWQIQVDDDVIKVDEIEPEFAIQDSKASGRGEDLTMYREILGGINKFTCRVSWAKGEELNKLRRLSRKPIVNLNIYNSMEGRRRQMQVSVKFEKMKIRLIGEEEYSEPLEFSFTQTGKDNV